jgi:predicted hotdog family 3-hydroxylacyl-ACP dehydratase
MMTLCPYAIADLLPHAAPMVLLERVTAWDDMGLTASLSIGPETRFVEAGFGVPAHIGIEWIAQACGAFAGLQAKSAGGAVRLGFLLSTRDFSADVSWFALGETMAVFVRQVFHEDGMAVFDCRIDAGGIAVARARLTVFQPADDDSSEEMT